MQIIKLFLAKRLTASSVMLDNSFHANEIVLGITPKGHRKQMKHSKYFHYPEVKNAKLNARAEAAIDLLVVLAIGVGMAVLLVAWWSA